MPERAVSLRWALLGVAAIVLVVHSLAYNFVTDDAYISFVFSRNLAEHGQLAFNVGQHVEGYTNFLWTFVLGLGMLVGVGPELSSRVLGTLCALATLYVVTRIMDRVLGRRSPWSAMPALLLASSSGFACWTSGGLETQLYTVLVSAALDALVAAHADPRALRRLGVLLALASMTRPEGPMIAAVLGAVWLAGKLLARRGASAAPWRFRDEALAIAWFLGLWLPWFAWRWWYYGWPFPNTYYVKATGPWAAPDMPHQMVGNGLYYVWVWLQQTRLVYALPLALVGFAAIRPRTPRALLAITCAVLAAVYLAYTISVGGDFMGLHRFIMPVFVIAALAVSLGTEWIAGKLRHPAAAPVLAIAVVGGFAVTQLALTRASTRWGNFASDHGIDTPAYLMVYTQDRAAIGRAMASCFTDDDFSIVGGAGAQPYLGRMRGVDVFGLVSETIAHDEPRVRPRAGHTKFGADRVLAAYDPTFVFSCYAIHDRPAQPALPCAPFWLARGYEEVTMLVPFLQEHGWYYTFLAKTSRHFECPGRVRGWERR